MQAILKRYFVAFVFLVLVVLLMLLGTLGVKALGDKMLEDTGTQMTPRGEKIRL